MPAHKDQPKPPLLIMKEKFNGNKYKYGGSALIVMDMAQNPEAYRSVGFPIEEVLQELGPQALQLYQNSSHKSSFR